MSDIKKQEEEKQQPESEVEIILPAEDGKAKKNISSKPVSKKTKQPDADFHHKHSFVEPENHTDAEK